MLLPLMFFAACSGTESKADEHTVDEGTKHLKEEETVVPDTATADTTVTEALEYFEIDGVVIREGVVLRRAPDELAEAVDHASSGMFFSLTEPIRTEEREVGILGMNYWYRCKLLNGSEGWIFGDNIAMKGMSHPDFEDEFGNRKYTDPLTDREYVLDGEVYHFDYAIDDFEADSMTQRHYYPYFYRLDLDKAIMMNYNELLNEEHSDFLSRKNHVSLIYKNGVSADKIEAITEIRFEEKECIMLKISHRREAEDGMTELILRFDGEKFEPVSIN